MMFGIAVTVRVARVLLLDVRRVGQHERTEVTRAGCPELPSFEPLRDEPWQIPAVIEVRVCKDHGVDVLRLNRERLPVSFAKFLETLKEPAIDKHPVGTRLEKMLGAGDRSGGS